MSSEALCLVPEANNYLISVLGDVLDRILCGEYLIDDISSWRALFKEKVAICINFSNIGGIREGIKDRVNPIESDNIDDNYCSDILDISDFNLKRFAEDTKKIRGFIGLEKGDRLGGLERVKGISELSEYFNKYKAVFKFLYGRVPFDEGQEKTERDRLLVGNKTGLDGVVSELCERNVRSHGDFQKLFTSQGINVSKLGSPDLSYLLNSLVDNIKEDESKLDRNCFLVIYFWMYGRGTDMTFKQLIEDLSLFRNKGLILEFFIGNLLSNYPICLGSIVKDFKFISKEVNLGVIAGMIQQLGFESREVIKLTGNCISISSFTDILLSNKGKEDVIKFLISIGLLFEYDISKGDDLPRGIEIRGIEEIKPTLTRLGVTTIYLQASKVNKGKVKFDIISPNGLLNITEFDKKQAGILSKVLLTKKVDKVVLGKTCGTPDKDYFKLVSTKARNPLASAIGDITHGTPGIRQEEEEVKHIKPGVLRVTETHPDLNICRAFSLVPASYGARSFKRLYSSIGEFGDLESGIDQIRKYIRRLIDIRDSVAISMREDMADADNDAIGYENRLVKRFLGVDGGLEGLRRKYGNRDLDTAIRVSGLSCNTISLDAISNGHGELHGDGRSGEHVFRGYETYDKFSLLLSTLREKIPVGEPGLGIAEPIKHVKSRDGKKDYVAFYVKLGLDSEGCTFFVSNNYSASTYVYVGDLTGEILDGGAIDLKSLSTENFPGTNDTYREIHFMGLSDKYISSRRSRVLLAMDCGPTLEELLVKLYNESILTDDIISGNFDGFVREWNQYIDHFIETGDFQEGHDDWKGILERNRYNIENYKLLNGGKPLNIDSLSTSLGGFTYFYRLNPSKELRVKYAISLLRYCSGSEDVGSEVGRIEQEAIDQHKIQDRYRVFYENLRDIIELGEDYLTSLYHDGNKVEEIALGINIRLPQPKLSGKNVPSFTKLVIDLGGTMEDFNYSDADDFSSRGKYITYLFRQASFDDGSYKPFFKTRFGIS